ncbi:MAG: hypothetical protein Q9225_004882 [Loekoesia sp. 1 TL-2023]
MAMKADSNIENSIQEPGASHDKKENGLIRNSMRQTEYSVDGSASLQRFVTIEKKKLEDQLIQMRAAQSISKRWGRFIARDVPTMNPNRQNEYGATTSICIQRSMMNRRKEPRNQIAEAEAELGILQSMERLLPCLDGSGLDQNAFDGWSTAILHSDDLSSPTSSSWSNPYLPTTFLMAIHRPDGNTKVHVAKLDTASRQNLVSRKLTLSMGLQVEAYQGRALQPIGPLLSPRDGVTFDWHVFGRQRTHRTTFAVLDDLPGVKLDFDILLSEHEIQNVGFYLQNHEVFYIQ